MYFVHPEYFFKSAFLICSIDLVKMNENVSMFVADVFSDLMDVAEEMSEGK